MIPDRDARRRRELARRAEAGDVEATRELLALNESAGPASGENDGWSAPLRLVRGRGGREWEFWRHLDGGHKVYRDPKTGRWAIADDSGRVPEEAEDGIVWIDAGKVDVGHWRSSGQRVSLSCMVEAHGEERSGHFSEPTSGIFWIAARLGLPVETTDGTFVVTRVGPSPTEDRRIFAALSEAHMCPGCSRNVVAGGDDMCRRCLAEIEDEIGNALGDE